MTAEEQDAARDLAVEFVSGIVIEKWRGFALPDSFLAEAMLAQGAAMLASGYPPMDVAERIRNLADAVEHGRPYGPASPPRSPMWSPSSPASTD